MIKLDSTIQKKVFGYINEKEITLLSLNNKNGVTVELINYGAIVKSILVPDKNGNIADVVLGYDTIEDYVNDDFFIGATIGRYAGRIANARFELLGKTYQLNANDNVNHLHGGWKGFNKVIWDYELIEEDNISSVKFSYLSVDGEEGYPGNLNVSVIYSLSDDNELIIKYQAETDEPTIINLTHHSYFNLSGQLDQSIADHIIFINADSFLSVNHNLIPTGKIETVYNTPFDLRESNPIGLKINEKHEQLKIGGGFDHTWVLNDFNLGVVRKAAEVSDIKSGRKLIVFTDQPGLQFYTGNFLNDSIKGKNNIHYDYRSAFCLEAQQFPDSPNQQTFPSVVLKPDKLYEQKTIYKFDLTES